MKVKYLGMMFLASFIGIMFNPELLAASDSVAILDLEQANVVETVVEKPIAPAKVVAPAAPKAGVVNVAVAQTVTMAQKTAEAPKTAANQVKFSWGTQNLILANDTSVDAGVSVMKYGRLLWAHNNTAFNNIKSLKIGDTFAVTINGVTQQYKVAANPIDKTAGVELEKKSATTLFHASKGEINMNALMDWGFGGHDLVLMTCAGAGNTHRFVVVADQI